jgi:hypothetical protein
MLQQGVQFWEYVYLGELRPADCPTPEDVDEAIEGARATLAFLMDLRQHFSASVDPTG